MDIKWALDKPFVELSGGWPRQTPLSCWRVVKLARARSLVLRSARLYGAQPPDPPAPLYSFHFLSANTPPALLMLWMRRLYVARQGEGELHQGCYIVCPWVQNRSHCHNNKGKAPKRELGSVRDVRGNVGDGRRHDLDAARENIFKTCVCVCVFCMCFFVFVFVFVCQDVDAACGIISKTCHLQRFPYSPECICSLPSAWKRLRLFRDWQEQ